MEKNGFSTKIECKKQANKKCVSYTCLFMGIIPTVGSSAGVHLTLKARLDCIRYIN